ncbi:MAG: L,D-transpeptidase family protein, partial [Methylocystis sp.]|nr:L,D-transpeptidase family protein [Methylocystis sp.]
MRLRTRSRARLFSKVAVTAATALGFARTPVMAQGFFFWGDREPLINAVPEPQRVPRPQRSAVRKKTSQPATDKSGAASTPDAKPEAAKLDRPLFLIASIADQQVSIYNHSGLVARSAISTGVAGHPTPKGIFTIIGRERFHRSNIYSSAPMPFMQRVTWSGIAMHLGVVPGHPASHGCIRLPAAFAAKLWGMTRIGERVVISPHDVFPAEFEHPLLPAPKMRASAEAEKGAPATDSEQPLHVAEDRPAIVPQPRAEQPKADAESPKADADTAGAANAAPTADPQQPSRVEADAPAANSAQEAEKPKAEAGAAVASADAAAPAADSQQPALDSADAPSKTEQNADQPKLGNVADKPATSAPSSPAAVAERLRVNPHQYAQQLKAKAVAEAAAANRAVKALSAEAGIKHNEAARAATALRAAEAAQATARVRADAAAALSAAATAAADSQQEPAVTAERSASA